MKKTLIVMTAILGVSACGGGGGDSSPSVNPPPASNESIGGIWYGYSTSDQGGGTQEMLGVATEDGRFRFISFDTGGQFTGTADTNGNVVTGTGLAYAALGTTWLNGSVVTSLGIGGSVSERSTFTGDWSAGTGETGSFSLSYDNFYDRDSSLDITAGTWTSFDGFGNPDGSYTIGTNGAISGQDVYGCLYSGNVTIIDSRYDVYNISITASNCGGANGTYTGLSVIGDSYVTNDTLWVAVDNGSLSVVLGLLR